MTVGALESILLEDDFSAQQKTFCLANSDVFEDSEENKLAYTPLFQAYTELIEKLLNEKLGALVPVSILFPHIYLLAVIMIIFVGL